MSNKEKLDTCVNEMKTHLTAAVKAFAEFVKIRVEMERENMKNSEKEN